MNTKPNIRSFSLEELTDFFVKNGEKAYRAKQVYEWLWKKNVRNFDEMTNLSKDLRQFLDEHFSIPHIKIRKFQRSIDGTIKNAVGLKDDLVVESVLIPAKKRTTACVSSQVGCSLDCKFCATGRLKNMRNLTPDEIVDQVVEANKQSLEYYGHPLTNIVFMGMGEPLLNYDNVMSAVDKITSDKALGMAARRITISTSGIPKNIRRMADEQAKVGLAVSLHSAIDDIRTDIMPVNKRQGDLKELLPALQYWYQKTKRKITFEYLVFKGINDDEKSIKALVNFAKKVPSKVNLIEYNPTDDSDRFQQADDTVLESYKEALSKAGITATVRRSKGQDIDAACGQLANKFE
ncbi:MAG TPA: 23S rRNA (adenine(2503)-C(2))-methyltransferase RlmN [Flavobacteriales bacterium]|nr:23S rRNA (adenine(2503)-C(2))-methyltransferase RlmN [Flavobacteriales bacterium]